MKKIPVLIFCLTIATTAFAENNQGDDDLSRGEVDQAMSDLSQALVQARAIPHSENGKPAGYKQVQVQPNAIYDHLSLKNDEMETVPYSESDR